MATLKEIALAAKVSQSTVSRILNNDPNLKVSDETRKKVLDIAFKLDYQIKNKNHKLNYRIALIHWYSKEEELNDNYYLRIRLGIEHYADTLGLELIKTFSGENNLTPADGAILIGKFDETEIKKFKNFYRHLVFVDYNYLNDNYDSIYVDFDKAYNDSIDYLKSLNINDIGFIGGLEYTKHEKKLIKDPRELAYLKRFPNSKKIHLGEFTINSGYSIMKEIIHNKNLAKAYLIANDQMALGSLKALHESNLKVPDDVSIIGFNDDPQSEFTIPPLTTIKVYKEHMGKKGVDLLIERIKGRTITEKIIVETKLVKRKSVLDK
ncbi:MAG: LacI family DNA-binding transcriptional regulator [Acholeplasmataceae bacterium]